MYIFAILNFRTAVLDYHAEYGLDELKWDDEVQPIVLNLLPIVAKNQNGRNVDKSTK